MGVVSGTTNVTLNTSPGSGGVIALQFSGTAGTAVDPANGDILTLGFILGDATEP
jgi:predicted outer membrane repeat protein